jgi:short-subunit dehydrogenase
MEQKRALVTGASSGIGREFAVQLAKEGYQVTALARSEAKLKELAAALGGGSRALVADLSTEEGVRLASDEMKGRHYDLLVNNAGFGVGGRFFETPLERQLEMLNVNVKALVCLAHAFLGQAKPGDALINISSGLAFLPMPSIGLYSATKALVTSFSESLWYEQKSRGVYVMGLCPGVTKTEFSRVASGEDVKAPKIMVQTAEQVVSKALHELKARSKPTVSSGAMNSIFGFMARFRTRKSVVSQMGSMGA